MRSASNSARRVADSRATARRRLLVLVERGCRALERSLEVFDQDEKPTVLLERVRDLRLQSVPLGSGSVQLRVGEREQFVGRCRQLLGVERRGFELLCEPVRLGVCGIQICEHLAALCLSLRLCSKDPRGELLRVDASLCEFLKQFRTVRCRLRFERAERGVGACGPRLELLDSGPRGAEI